MVRRTVRLIAAFLFALCGAAAAQEYPTRPLRDKGIRYILECCRSMYAFAAASANGPPEPMAITPSSGSTTSPSPETTRICSLSATRSCASRRRR